MGLRASNSGTGKESRVKLLLVKRACSIVHRLWRFVTHDLITEEESILTTLLTGKVGLADS